MNAKQQIWMSVKVVDPCTALELADTSLDFCMKVAKRLVKLIHDCKHTLDNIKVFSSFDMNQAFMRDFGNKKNIKGTSRIVIASSMINNHLQP